MEYSFKIFLLSDHPLVKEGVKALLKNCCKDVIITDLGNLSNPKPYLKLQADMVLIALNLPRQEIIAKIRQIKTLLLPQNILVVGINNEGVHQQEFTENGATGYLYKAATLSEWTEAVNAVAKGRFYVNNKSYDSKELLLLNQKKGGNSAEGLSKREKEILRLILKEYNTQEIAEKLFISPRTVETHRRNIIDKLNVKNTVGLVKRALQLDLTH